MNIQHIKLAVGNHPMECDHCGSNNMIEIGLVAPKCEDCGRFSLSHMSIDVVEEITGTGHVVGATYRSHYWGGVYKVIRSVFEFGVLVECVEPGQGAHQTVGEQWAHSTKLDKRDQRLS
jgi:hypothetical protein